MASDTQHVPSMPVCPPIAVPIMYIYIYIYIYIHIYIYIYYIRTEDAAEEWHHDAHDGQGQGSLRGLSCLRAVSGKLVSYCYVYIYIYIEREICIERETYICPRAEMFFSSFCSSSFVACSSHRRRRQARQCVELRSVFKISCLFLRPRPWQFEI